ncbi:unnamed protein product [marine sediment metagenome]|uniref:Uncharacterized protein n=1 Tax=marine sediment metagenome TaxID=412755 RepID=X1ANY3_9ZZZZ
MSLLTKMFKIPIEEARKFEKACKILEEKSHIKTKELSLSEAIEELGKTNETFR